MNFEKLTLEDVRIFGVSVITSFENANAKKKLFAHKVVFDATPDKVCHSEEGTNELVCEKNPDYNGASLISSSVLPPLILLALIKIF